MRKKLFYFVCTTIFPIFLSIFICRSDISIAYADTHITNATPFKNSVTWTKDKSPYLIDSDVYIPAGVVLSIEPGVVVTTSTTSPGSLFIAGTLIANGTKALPITIQKLKGFTIFYSTSSISNAIITISNGLNIIKGSIEISSSTISGSDKAITAQGVSLLISNSIILGNNYGIYSIMMPPPIFQAFNFFKIPVAYAQVVSDLPNENHIIVSSSSFIGNSTYAIYNATPNNIIAQNNWWGSSSGPTVSGGLEYGDKVYGPVDYTPWLTKDPNSNSQVSICCSNVLFLPGLQASRLYVDEKSFIGTSTNQLWEPNRNDDVRKLFMTTNGASINSGIYTKDIVDSAFGLGLFPVYKNFITMMDGVVSSKMINSWVSYPYDWRYDISTIVSQKLVDVVKTLASSSKTGKVTIVAHSNGGLVAKLLGKVLADQGEANLLDKVILVAVPQLGTPEAIVGLLHGDDEGILGGVITSQSVARQLGENMPGGYGLLPSKEYYSTNTPLVTFTPEAISDFNFTSNDRVINTYNTMHDFLTGNSDHRINPLADDINSPVALHSSMVDEAQKIHDTIDSFSFGSTTSVTILAGWDKPTLSSVSYFEKKVCSENAFTAFLNKSSSCSESLEHSASSTLLGDGTVVLQSAVAQIKNALNYYLDLGSESKGKVMSDSHSTILSTDSAVAFVKNIIIASTSSTQSQNTILPAFISDKPPVGTDIHQDDLVISVHSPVELNVYDSVGRHTGPIPNLDPTSDLGKFETNIPGSEYVPNEGNTYIRVPYGTTYKVTFAGTGLGSFEVDTDHEINGLVASSTIFADMPVTPLLKAELLLATSTSISLSNAASSSVPIATPTTTQMIVFDFNGDGVIDATSTPHDQYDPVLDMESYQTIISSLGLSPFKEKTMYDKLSIIIDCLKKKKPLKETEKPDKAAILAAQKAIVDLQNQHWVFKGLDPVRKQKLEDIFQAFIDNIVAP